MAEYSYEAFISYSHADQRVAKWLHRAIEHFRIPKHLITEPALTSNRFLPLFLDKDELAAAHHLPDVLEQALAASRHLIVICSPQAANSSWVNQEVSAFIELGRQAQIICVLVGGDPADPETCFPQALRETTTPLAVDLRAGGEGRKPARMRIAAALLGVGYDQLRQRAVQQQRRRLRNRTAVATLVLVTIAFVSYRAALVPPCQNSADRLAGIWNSTVRSAIEESFLATSLPYATSALTNVMGRLQSYHDQWITMHTETCEATLVRNEQSPRLMDLRMVCLDERRDEYSSLVRLLQQADHQIVDSAVASAGRLRTLSRCADAQQLELAYPLPEDPDERAILDQLQVAVADAAVALSAGRVASVGSSLPDLLIQSAALGYPPLEAEALLLQSRFESSFGRAASAKDATYAAAAKAVLARDNELIARAWLTLPRIAINTKGDLDEIAQLLELARSYIAQLPDDHPLEADFHGTRGELRLRRGELDTGVEDMRTAVRISRELNLPDLPSQLTRLAWGLAHLYQPAEAFTVALEARDMTEREFGPNHPEYAHALKELARVQSQLGNREEALVLQSQAVAIDEALYPDAHPVLAGSIERLGWTYTQVGRFEDAIAAFERAIAMEHALEEANWTNIAAAYNDLGDAYISKGDYPSARTALEKALDVWIDQGHNLGIGIALGNLGNTSNRAGRYAEAADYCKRGYDNDARYLPVDHPDLAYSLTCLGEAYVGAQNPVAAIAPLKRAHRLRDRNDIDKASLAWTRWLYGRALWESGRDRDTGMEYVRFAVDTFSGIGTATSSELASVQDWLAEHGLD